MMTMMMQLVTRGDHSHDNGDGDEGDEEDGEMKEASRGLMLMPATSHGSRSGPKH